MYPKSSDGLNRETNNAVYFFTPAFHPFDNFSAHQVELWGKLFPTAEHAFQWKKFSDVAPSVAERIFVARSPDLVKVIALEYQSERRKDWAEVRISVMHDILLAKTTQHADVRERLIASGSRMIIEASPEDVFWGIGPDGRGENWVGKIWMEIRESFNV